MENGRKKINKSLSIFMKKHIIINVFGFILIFILILLPTIIRENQLDEFKVKLRDYSKFEFYLNSMKRDSKRALINADNAINNKFDFQIKNSNYPTFQVDELKELWKNDSYHSNTHQFYAHSLIILWDLLIAHKSNEDSQYLRKGMELIKSWSNNNQRYNPFNQRYAWEDHSTAKRIIAVLLFADYAKEFIEIKGYENSIFKLTNYSAEFLNSYQNYSQNSNHGIYQDIALLIIALHCEDEFLGKKLISKAIIRFSNQVKNTFSNKGFHLENSPGYHYITTSRCEDFLNLCHIAEIYPNNSIVKIINKAQTLRNVFVLPNDRILNFGDTDSKEARGSYEADSLCIYDLEAGYFIFKDGLNYFAARTQSPSKIHRHYDTMSFILFINGKEVISDTGFLSYSKNNDRFFTKSMQAHNTLIPEQKLGNYNYFYNAKFVKYSLNQSVLKIILATCDDSIERLFLFDILNKNFIILDNIRKKAMNYLQVFNFNKNSDVYYTGNSDVKSYFGNKNPKLGWEAVPLTKLKKSTTIINKGKNKLLSVFSKEKPLSIDHNSNKILIKFSSELFEYSIKDKEYHKFKNNEFVSIGNEHKLSRLSYYRRNQMLLFNIILFILSILVIVIINPRIKLKIISFIPLIIGYFTIIYLYLNYYN